MFYEEYACPDGHHLSATNWWLLGLPTMSYIIDFSARGDIEINEICLTSHVPRFELIKDGRKSNFSR